MYARNFSAHGPQWLAGHITILRGPVSVEIQLEDGSRIIQHFDQICKKSKTTSENTMSDLMENPEASALCHTHQRTWYSTLRLLLGLRQDQPTMMLHLPQPMSQCPIQQLNQTWVLVLFLLEEILQEVANLQKD